jgi:hypothetical protein
MRYKILARKVSLNSVGEVSLAQYNDFTEIFDIDFTGNAQFAHDIILYSKLLCAEYTKCPRDILIQLYDIPFIQGKIVNIYGRALKHDYGDFPDDMSFTTPSHFHAVPEYIKYAVINGSFEFGSTEIGLYIPMWLLHLDGLSKIASLLKQVASNKGYLDELSEIISVGYGDF